MTDGSPPRHSAKVLLVGSPCPRKPDGPGRSGLGSLEAARSATKRGGREARTNAGLEVRTARNESETGTASAIETETGNDQRGRNGTGMQGEIGSDTVNIGNIANTGGGTPAGSGRAAATGRSERSAPRGAVGLLPEACGADPEKTKAGVSCDLGRTPSQSGRRPTERLGRTAVGSTIALVRVRAMAPMPRRTMRTIRARPIHGGARVETVGRQRVRGRGRNGGARALGRPKAREVR
mmetsp:Transcript_57558/g.153315  ORF Transcript_57558/g.153315 Transcript_57558/m.153315 type:complete len:237 (-) Transcript_57558:74-784(-)